jgi:hypothetical protein
MCYVCSVISFLTAQLQLRYMNRKAVKCETQHRTPRTASEYSHFPCKSSLTTSNIQSGISAFVRLMLKSEFLIT